MLFQLCIAPTTTTSTTSSWRSVLDDNPNSDTVVVALTTDVNNDVDDVVVEVGPRRCNTSKHTEWTLATCHFEIARLLLATNIRKQALRRRCRKQALQQHSHSSMRCRKQHSHSSMRFWRPTLKLSSSGDQHRVISRVLVFVVGSKRYDDGAYTHHVLLTMVSPHAICARTLQHVRC
jgi:hypothetical protein